MYEVEQGAEELGSEWHGPALVLGWDGKVAWLMHIATPIAGSANRLQPQTQEKY